MKPFSRPIRTAFFSLLLSVLCLPAGACQRPTPDGTTASRLPSPDTPSEEKPIPPLDLPQPAPLASTFEGQDLRQLDAHALLRRARQLGNSGQDRAASVYQYWAVAKSGAEQYDLACYLARLGEVEAAFYWLQVAGLEDGVDARWADVDGDLERLRQDTRWPAVQRYLHQCTAYWAAHGKPTSVLILPKDYDGKKPLPALVWLHGSNSGPDFRDNASAMALEDAADRLKVAVLGVSGTIVFGKAKFKWSEEPERDFRRVQDALKEVGDRVKIRPADVILIGFSQGGQVGLEVAARHPESFAGAIALAPGAEHDCQLGRATRLPLLASRGFVVVTGKLDSPDRHKVAAADVEWLRGSKAKVEQKVYPAGGHWIPSDFGQRLPEWVRFIESARGK